MSPYLWPARFQSAKPVGGDEQNRTVDPLLARQVLSQLSYTPTFVDTAIGQENKQREKSPTTIREFLTLDVFFITTTLHRKEVIQPHLPIRLPCYDFTPVANPTFGSALTRLSY